MLATKMHKESQKEPELRFPEFSGEWEEKRLGEVSKIERGRFSPRPRNNPIYYNGDVPFVQTSDVVNSRGKISEYSQTLNEKGVRVSKVFEKGTVLLTIAANIGHSGVLQIDMACPDSLVGLVPNKETDSECLNYYLSTQQERMERLAPEAAQKNINIEFLKPYPAPLPALSEQRKIASFLSAVDGRIEGLEKRRDLLKDYKKGLMQKLFNQSLRFQSQSGNPFPDWTEKRLGEVGEIKKGEQLNKDSLFDSEPYPALNGGVIPSGYTDKWNVEADTITISEGGNSCGFVNFMTERFWCGGHCYALLGLKNGVVKDFLFQILKHNESYLMSLRVGSGLPNIQKKDLLKVKLKFPNLEEQKKIADCLSALDHKIGQVETQVERTKEFKQGLLQKMFV